MKTIDLRKYNGYQHGDGVPVFAGRDKAEFYWKDNGVRAGDDVLLIVPDNCMCLVGTFLCSLVCRLNSAVVEGPEYWQRRVQELKTDHERFHDTPFRLF